MSFTFSRYDLAILVAWRGDTCATIYLPLSDDSSSGAVSRHEVDRLLSDVEEQLEKTAAPATARQAILTRIRSKYDETEASLHGSAGLAIFAASDFCNVFGLPMRPSRLVHIGTQFLTSPVLPVLFSNARFYVLAVTAQVAELHEVTSGRQTAGATDTGRFSGQVAVNAGIADMASQRVELNERQREPTEQPNLRTPATAMSADVRRFLTRQVDAEVCSALQGQHVPLVLACCDELAPLYRAANSYDHLLPGHVPVGSSWTASALESRALQLVAPKLRQNEAVAQEKYSELAQSDRTIHRLPDMLQAATRGRIETLLIRGAAMLDCLTNPSSDTRPVAEKSEAAQVEQVVQRTLVTGGEVLDVEEIPDNGDLAAILRF